MKNTRQTAKFLVTAGLILAFLQGYDAIMGAPNTPEASYIASAEAAKSIPALALPEMQKRLAHPSKVKLVFIHASWCPHCRRQKPIMEQLQAQYGDRIDIISIATDTDIDKLAVYLQQNPSSIESYRLSKAAITGLRSWLKSINSSYNGGIPHSVVIGKSGELVDEVTGFISFDNFKQGIDTLL